MAYQNFSSSSHHGDDHTEASSKYPTQEGTEIDHLRRHCMAIAEQRRIRGSRQLFELKVASVVKTLNLCLLINESKSAFPEKFREFVTKAIMDELDGLAEELARNRKATVGEALLRFQHLKHVLQASRDPVDKNAAEFNRSLKDTSQAKRRRGLMVSCSGSVISMFKLS